MFPGYGVYYKKSKHGFESKDVCNLKWFCAQIYRIVEIRKKIEMRKNGSVSDCFNSSMQYCRYAQGMSSTLHMHGIDYMTSTDEYTICTRVAVGSGTSTSTTAYAGSNLAITFKYLGNLIEYNHGL